MTECRVNCATHAQTVYSMEHRNVDWLRANLPLIRRLGRSAWARHCTCNLVQRVEEAIRRVH